MTPQIDPDVLARQAPLDLSLPDSVSIVGCGGVGSWLAMFLALARVPVLFLWDFDTVSVTNLNRLPIGREFLNQPKSDSIRLALARLSESTIFALPRWTADAALQLGYGVRRSNDNHWLVAATDTWKSRLELHAHALEQRLHYIELSAEGEFGGITGEPATFATPEEQNPGYASVPVHVGPCVLAASMAAYHILHSTPVDAGSYRIGWSRTRNCLEVQGFHPSTVFGKQE